MDGVSAAFGLHVWPTLPSGTIATKKGTIMAASQGFEVSDVATVLGLLLL